MNKRPIESASDPDLRFSGVALKRAARRARELAAQTGTHIVVSRHGVVREILPQEEQSTPGVHEPTAPYGDKR